MDMTNNKVYKKKVLKTILSSIEGSKIPFDLYVVEYNFNVISSRFSEMDNSEITEILNHFLNVFRGVFTPNEIKKIFIFPELEWNSEGYYHQIIIRFCIVGNRLKRKRFNLFDLIKKSCVELFGGDFTIRNMTITDLTDLVIELLPIPMEESDITYKNYKTLNYFPKFYTKDLYSFLINFYETINNEQFTSNYKIQL